MNLDSETRRVLTHVLNYGTETTGRTKTNRIRVLEGIEIEHDCSDGMMSILTLRKNNPSLAIAETLGFLSGATSVSELERVHPALKLWKAWAGYDGDLGGVYGKAFHEQYINIVDGLIYRPTSSHHRMTTLIPSKFPIPGNSYADNVKADKFSLMPCLHSYHFLSDGVGLWLHATQASGDLPVGVFPHNAYQVQFMLLLTAYFTGLKPMSVKHHIHDAHIYTNQVKDVETMLKRKGSDTHVPIDFGDLLVEYLHPYNFNNLMKFIDIPVCAMHDPIKMEVDS